MKNLTEDQLFDFTILVLERTAEEAIGQARWVVPPDVNYYADPEAYAAVISDAYLKEFAVAFKKYFPSNLEDCIAGVQRKYVNSIADLETK